MKCLQQNQVAILRRLASIDRHQNQPHVLSVLNPTTDAKEHDRMSITSAGTRGSGIDDLKLKRNKVFKQILNSHAKQFDGKKVMAYKPWKDALNREIDGHDLDANQKMDLLLMRTTGIAKDFVQHSRDAYLQDDPEQAL